MRAILALRFGRRARTGRSSWKPKQLQHIHRQFLYAGRNISSSCSCGQEGLTGFLPSGILGLLREKGVKGFWVQGLWVQGLFEVLSFWMFLGLSVQGFRV